MRIASNSQRLFRWEGHSECTKNIDERHTLKMEHIQKSYIPLVNEVYLLRYGTLLSP